MEEGVTSGAGLAAELLVYVLDEEVNGSGKIPPRPVAELEEVETTVEELFDATVGLKASVDSALLVVEDVLLSPNTLKNGSA